MDRRPPSPLRTSIPLAVAAACAILAAGGCSRDTSPLDPWPLDTDPIVFQDNFTGAVEYQAFGNSKLDALSTDSQEQYAGTGCVRITVPNAGAGYAGGAFVAHRARNLSVYNALTFYAKASRAASMDVGGLGNNNSSSTTYAAGRTRIPLTTTWTKCVIPIPLPSKLGAESGLFFFAASVQGGAGYTAWFDEIQYENLTTLSAPRPSMTSQVQNTFVGSTVTVTGTRTTFDVGTTGPVVVEHEPAYFTFESSDSSVAIPEDGTIRVVGEGAAVISARLDTTLVTGSVVVSATPFTPGLAPTPIVPAANVISLFSNAYANVPVDRWSADWDRANVADLSIYGNDMKQYTSLEFAGIEFISHPIDASAMTHFHMDVYAPSGTTFRVKLVDFGADGLYGGTGENHDSERELTFNAGSTPSFAAGDWVGLEIPLSDFMNGPIGLVSRAHLAQLIISSGDAGTVYLDNIYFHR